MSFRSLSDPDSISLTSSTKQDLFIIEILKSGCFILNSLQGSLVLDKSDFDEEDGTAFYSSVPLQPQKIAPKIATTQSV